MKTHRIAAAAALAGVAPRGLASAIRNEVSPTELIQQMKATLDATLQANSTKVAALEKTMAEFNAALDSKTKDVVSQAKIDAINASIDKQILELKASTAGIGKLDKSIEDVQKEIDGMNAKISALALNGGGGRKADPRAANPAFGDYSKAFNTWFRKGGGDAVEATLRTLEVQAAMTTTSNPDGGFTVVPEMEQAIDEVLKEVSPMRQLATIRQVGASNEYKKLVNQHGTASGWVGETESRIQTVGPTLSELKFPVMELYAMPAASGTLLDDSFVNMEQWLATEVETEFAYQEGVAFISGTGVNRPKGFIGGYTPAANASYAWGNPGYIASGASGAFVADPNGDKCLIDTYLALKSAYRTNSSWVMNRGTIGAIRKLKDSDGVSLIQMSPRRDGMIEELMGRPVIEMPDMPDIGANTYSVAIADWKRAYLIIDRVGIRVIRDNVTSKPYVLFYTTKRVGGGLQNFEAIKLLKFAAS